MSAGLSATLIGRIAIRLESDLSDRRPGHCVRVDDLAVIDARAVAEEVRRRAAELDVHVLAARTPAHPLEIEVDRAIELRNRKPRPLLLLVPTGIGHAASSLDNSFEPVPLVTLLKDVSTSLEKELSATPVASLISEVRHVLGRTRRVEPWALFLGAVMADPTASTVGRQLWQVGLVPDLNEEGIETRLRRNAKAVAAISRPSRPTARVIDRIADAGVKAGRFRQDLDDFLEQQEAGALADAARWTRRLVEHDHGALTFGNWPLVEYQDAGLTQVKLTPFRKDDGTVDPRCKLRLGEDEQLYCDVAPDKPGSVVVNWTTEPARTSAVATWRVEVLPPEDLRAEDTPPIATMRVKGDKRRSTLRIDVDADDLTMSTLFVVRVRALDGDDNELELQDRKPAAAESDQFEIKLGDQASERSPRLTGAASLPEAVLRTAIDVGGDLTESAPVWDPVGQVFDLRIGGHGTRIRVSRIIKQLQRRMMEQAGTALTFDASSPLGETIDPDAAKARSLSIPAALADRRNKLLAAFAARSPRDVVEVLSWDEELRGQVRSYVQSYRRALDSADPENRPALLSMDTLTVRVGTATDEVHGLVLLPTHPLRLGWVAAHDELLRGWADEVATAGKSKSDRASRIDFGVVSRLSPANMPFIMTDNDGHPFVYAEELTYGSALYLSPTVREPESASDVICGVIDVVRENTDLGVSSRALGDRIRSYRSAHPGTGTLRIMAVNPGPGGILRKALAPLVLGQTEDGDDGPAPHDPQRLEIIAYSDRLSYTNPVAELRELQRAVTAAEIQRTATHLAPPLGLAARDLDRVTQDHEGHHLAVVQDLARTDVVGSAAETSLRTTAFRDLLTTLRSEQAPEGYGTWYVTPALKPRTSGRLEADVIDAHRAHQNAVAAQLELSTAVPALAIHLDLENIRRLDAVHERADWVVTLDRGIGPELFDEAAQDEKGRNRYLLDYAPDFLEGLGKKLTVTTVHDGEVRRILGDAMRKLGIAETPDSVSTVLSRLLLVSGRLALRLLRETTQSIEAVSLAAVMAHLERREQLDGRIVVPVDAHPEIFGARQGNGDEPARRCDLLLVRVTQRSLRIECVEVKGRGTAQLPIALADDIVDQVDQTERVLQRQFFASDPPRFDAGLQRTRLAGLLHYYAERSAQFGLITADRLPELHRNIDKIEESTEPPEITKAGYVISPDGTAGFPARHRDVPIKVLIADDLGQAGFTTISVGASTPGQEKASQTADTFISPADGQSSAIAASGACGEVVDEGSSPAGAIAENADQKAVPVVSVELGSDGAGTPVTWNVSTKGSPHAFILGIPGQGKSVTTRRIIREFADQGLSSLVMDFHGDMAANPSEGAEVIDAAEGLQFSPFELPSADSRSLNETAWEVAEIIAYVCGLGEIQRGHVYEGLRQAYADAKGVPTMTQFVDSVERTEREARGRNARDRIRPLTDFGLFADDPADTFAASLQSGAVIDLSRLALETVQLAAGAFVLRKIYREMFRWEQAGVMRLAVVLDEAHRLAKDLTLPKLLKEGRKYGVSVVVASQGMADFHRDVLGNAGTKIVFRTNFPESKATAGFLRGREGQDLSQQIEQLDVGSAYVSTPNHVRAQKVYMHP